MSGEPPLRFGRFVAEARVGQGAMGTVYRGRDPATSAAVAIKVLRDAGEGASARFQREAEVLDELRHPFIVSYVAHGITPARQRYLVMEWLEGIDLRQHLLDHAPTVAQALQLGARIADALAFAHARGVVHRDVKPSNIFLPGGRLEDAKLIDFGIARVLGDDTRLTASGAILGTVAYMAPEQLRGERHLDARADLFALGTVLYECLGGAPPHAGRSALAIVAKRLVQPATRVSAHRPGVPAALDELVEQLLAIDASARPADSGFVAEALRLIASGRAPAGPPPREGLRAWSLSPREERLVAVVLSLASSLPDGEEDPFSSTEVGDVPPAGEDGQRTAQAIAQLVERFGGRIAASEPGSFAVVLRQREGGSAADLATRAARLAAGLRAAVEGPRLALAIGQAAGSRDTALDDLVDQMIANLAATPTRPAGSIDIDETAARLLSDRLEVARDELGPFIAAATRSGRATIDPPRSASAPLVGRVAELRLLNERIDEAIRTATPRVMVVSGEPGIGKSRLVAEAVGARRDGAVVVWSGQCDPLLEGSSLGVLASVLRGAAGVEEGDAPTGVEERLQALAAPVAADERPRVVEFVAEMCGLALPGAPSEALRAARASAMLLADQRRRAWEDLVTAVAGRAPLLLVLEDTHWCDAASMTLVHAAVRAAGARPLVVLATTRPRDGRAEGDAFVLALAELSPAGAAELVTSAAGDRLDEEGIAALVARGAGNPLFLSELARAALGSPSALTEVPESVRAMALARLAGLPVESRRVLRAGSIFGEAFSAAGVRALLGEASEVGETALRDLCRRDWLEVLAERPPAAAAGAQFRFRHMLFRDAAYASLTALDREHGHRLAGEWLARHGERDAARLATHFERGGDRVRSAVSYAQAAEQALAASDLDAALAHAARAEACGARGEQLGEVRLVEAAAYHWRAAHVAEHRAAMEALRLLAPLSASWYRAVDRLADASLPLSDLDTLVALAEVLEEPPSGLERGSDARASFRTAAATLTMQLALAGRLELAREVMARLETSVAEGGVTSPLVRGRIEFAYATLAMIDNDLDRLIESSRLAVGSFDEAGDLRDAALMRTNLAWALAEVGDWQEAEAELRAAAAVAERMGLDFVLGGVKSNLGLVLARRGRLDEALAAEQAAVAFYLGAANPRLEGQSRLYLALIHLASGALEAAEREARAAVACVALIRPTRAHALAQLAQVLLARGNLEEAEAPAAEAVAILDELGGIDEGEALVRLVRAETHERAGRRDEARATVEDAKQRLLAKAARISDASWRESFLRGVPENARTLELAEAWGA